MEIIGFTKQNQFFSTKSYVLLSKILILYGEPCFYEAKQTFFKEKLCFIKQNIDFVWRTLFLLSETSVFQRTAMFY